MGARPSRSCAHPRAYAEGQAFWAADVPTVCVGRPDKATSTALGGCVITFTTALGAHVHVHEQKLR